MFTSRLQCENCGFTTKIFVEGYSLHKNAHTCLYRNVKTGMIRIAQIPESELQQRNIDPNSDDFDEILANTFADSDEIPLDVPFGVDNVEIAVPCPRCGAAYLVKLVEGIE